MAMMALIMATYQGRYGKQRLFITRGAGKTNAELVERMIRGCKEYGRDIATPDAARTILGLPKNS